MARKHCQTGIAFDLDPMAPVAVSLVAVESPKVLFLL